MADIMYLNEELDKLIDKLNRTNDPNQKYELECEIANCISEMGV